MADNSYAVAVNAPHATEPRVLVDLWFSDKTGHVSPCDANELLLHSRSRPQVWIPSLETWTLETVRVALHELAAFLPTDEHATAEVSAKVERPRGRRPKHPLPHQMPHLSPHVIFAVEARGWRASIDTFQNRVMTTNPTTGVEVWAGQDTGDWTEPMQATLLDLTARSPFPLTQIAPAEPNPRWIARSTETPQDRRARPPKVLRRAIEMLRNAIRDEGYDPDDFLK